MIRMICRNRVADFDKWKEIFDSHAAAHREAGLTLEHLWRGKDDPAEVFFVFKVADVDKAKAFISAPDAEQIGRKAGVVDGEYWFVE